ncbi:BON domain-containing protein [Oligoflexus tunisiensis]|uniref:BON domain-containing protein n=1 Tax=Oligoflexus tunisiensis TaxID=708132 RepID=UPI00114D0849|nr:BON domain-containing protein [Oligoflexus tunisiensis]
MFEQGYENDDRYTQQGRRPQSPYFDRRGSSRRQDDDRFESQDRYRYRGQESERRYTRPDYDSDLDIERPGQPHFASRGSDYGRDHEQESSWQRPYRGQRHGDRFGHDGSNRYDFSRGGQVDYGSYGRGMADWGRGMGDYGSASGGGYGRGQSDYGRDWSSGAGMGHADWNRTGPDDMYQGWGRRSFDQQSQQPFHYNEQKNRWPKSYKRSDERIKDDIHEELIRHGRIDASDIEVQVKDGEVTLTGQVTSRHDKRIAEELAEKVLGVHDVQNQLRVRSGQMQNQGSDQQGSMSSGSMSNSPNLPGSNRMSVAGQQQQGQDQNKSAVNQTNK